MTTIDITPILEACAQIVDKPVEVLAGNDQFMQKLAHDVNRHFIIDLDHDCFDSSDVI